MTTQTGAISSTLVGPSWLRGWWGGFLAGSNARIYNFGQHTLWHQGTRGPAGQESSQVMLPGPACGTRPWPSVLAAGGRATPFAATHPLLHCYQSLRRATSHTGAGPRLSRASGEHNTRDGGGVRSLPPDRSQPWFGPCFLWRDDAMWPAQGRCPLGAAVRGGSLHLPLFIPRCMSLVPRVGGHDVSSPYLTGR